MITISSKSNVNDKEIHFKKYKKVMKNKMDFNSLRQAYIVQKIYFYSMIFRHIMI